LYELYKKAYTPWNWFKKLKSVAYNEGIIFFATAFDNKSVDLLEGLNVPFHKIASFELIDLPLIKYMANTKKPIIMSTGMATIPEIREAVSSARRYGAKDVALLKCVSSYPAGPEEMNLATIPDMKKLFKCKIGLSDHSLGIGVPIAAVSLGAKIIEKHFTLSKKIRTPDSFFSIEPLELKALVDNIRIVEKAIGKVDYRLTENSRKSIIFRRSLFIAGDIKKGEVFNESNVKSVRPSFGMRPKYLDKVIGKKARMDIKAGTPLEPKMIS
ncbi:MAG: pseudaminic acid synthase, partial [Candidatus Omnitrophica bacterium]|nr:pseudaminic acid synthase [Candidatus Omnitrophota bacterium]